MRSPCIEMMMHRAAPLATNNRNQTAMYDVYWGLKLSCWSSVRPCVGYFVIGKMQLLMLFCLNWPTREKVLMVTSSPHHSFLFCCAYSNKVSVPTFQVPLLYTIFCSLQVFFGSICNSYSADSRRFFLCLKVEGYQGSNTNYEGH